MNDMKINITINDGLLISLLDNLREEGTNKIAQPHLIVGENGSGKTFLLNRLFAEIEKKTEISLTPVFIEGKVVFSTEDFWRQCASSLQIQTGVTTFEEILSWQKRNSHRIILLVDNIQYYFNRTGNDEHFNLRGKLNRPGAPAVIATSDKVLPAFTDYNAAFFDGFKISYMKSLTPSDIQKIVATGTDMTRLKNLMSYLPQTPRALLIVLGILDISNNSETDIALLKDYFSLYCQTEYDKCAVQIQKILSALANMNNGGTLQDIRQMTGEDNGKLSPYLKSMIDKKLINKESKTPRSGKYTIANPLLKLWLQNSIKTPPPFWQ